MFDYLHMQHMWLSVLLMKERYFGACVMFVVFFFVVIY